MQASAVGKLSRDCDVVPRCYAGSSVAPTTSRIVFDALTVEGVVGATYTASVSCTISATGQDHGAGSTSAHASCCT